MRTINSTYICLFLAVMLLFLNTACEKSVIDDQKPEVDLTATGAHPLNCEVLYFGEPFRLNYLFKDNVALGSYTVDIHHNFDHHSHSTEVGSCDFLPDKVAVNPFLLIEEGKIPEGLTVYQLDEQITLPTFDSDGPFDEGDYHLTLRLTDQEGWSVQKGISIQILHRQR